MKCIKYYHTIIFLIIAACFACSQASKSNKNAPPALPANPQKKAIIDKATKAFLLQVDSLKMLLSKADTLNPMSADTDAMGNIEGVNSEISNKLTAILKNPQADKQNIDSLLRHNFLAEAHSADKRLRIFSWYENTGGSFKSNLSLVYYKTASGQTIISGDTESGSGQGNLFSSAGASFDTIYKLTAKGKDLYLCIGSGVGCTTCVFSTAVVVELKKDSANFNYPAFTAAGDDVITYGENNTSCLTFGARNGDIDKFEFNPKTQTLTIAYLTDDNTPIQRGDDEKQERIVRKLKFNGIKFIGDVFH